MPTCVMISGMETMTPTELTRLVERFEWLYRNNADAVTAETIRKTLLALCAATAAANDAFENDQQPQAQQALEDALMHLLVGLKRMGASPNESLARAWQRVHQRTELEKAFHIFTDRVEVRVGGEVQGTWPLFTLEDYNAFAATARDLGCPVVHHDMRQLELF